MEIELIDENETIDMPKEITVIREVTFESEYKNYNIARNLK